MAKTTLNRRNFLRVSALAGGGFVMGLYPKAAAPVRDIRLRRQRRFYLARRQDRELTGAAGALRRFLTEGHKEQGG